MTVPYDDLDPGIRAVVRWLNENGFETVDSGDGVSKFEADEVMECAQPFPNVAIRVLPPDRLVHECQRLTELLDGRGIRPLPFGPEEDEDFHIQATFDPSLEPEHQSFILLVGLNDALMDSL